MSKQTIALAYTRPADALEESEYQALLEALSESARGRGFLAEHARRSRSAETNILLTAIERIEAQVRPRLPERDPIYDDLRRVLDDIRTARARIEVGGKVPKAEQLDALLELLQRRIAKLMPLPPAANIQPAAPPTQTVAAPAPTPSPSAAHWLDTLPEPSLADNDLGPPRATAARNDARVPRAPAAKLEPDAPAAPVAEIEPEMDAAAASEARSKPNSPFAPAAEPIATATFESAEEALAAIMALSEEERIALFS